MRNNIMKEMENLQKVCRCIRCREVKAETYNKNEPVLHVEKYKSSGGTEYFISYEDVEKKVLYGMVRLRLNDSIEHMMGELIDCALIRELHVYGIHSGIGDSFTDKTQHKGLGRKLLHKAEEIAYENGFEKIVVISGVGVKEYYRKNGYDDYNTYMIKHLQPTFFELIFQIMVFIFVIMIMFYFI
jgi:elongator complex protein 3